MIAGSNAEQSGSLDDLVVVERVQAPRSVAGTPGCFMMKRIVDSEGRPRVFPCSIAKMSPMAITFNASVSASVGDWIMVSFNHLGRFEGPIIHVTKRTVSMRIVATQQERDRVAAKLAWIEDNEQAERRRFERFVPNEPHSSLSLATGETLPCTLIDYSVGGAAVFADVTPAPGTALKIAKVYGRVVRHFNGGFAVNFANVQDPKAVESLLHDEAAGHAA